MAQNHLGSCNITQTDTYWCASFFFLIWFDEPKSSRITEAGHHAFLTNTCWTVCVFLSVVEAPRPSSMELVTIWCCTVMFLDSFLNHLYSPSDQHGVAVLASMSKEVCFNPMNLKLFNYSVSVVVRGLWSSWGSSLFSMTVMQGIFSTRILNNNC